MKKYLASFLLILVGIWQTITAQNTIKSKFKHQLDIGLNNGFVLVIVMVLMD
jgi:hypothetical protein